MKNIHALPTDTYVSKTACSLRQTNLWICLCCQQCRHFLFQLCNSPSHCASGLLMCRTQVTQSSHLNTVTVFKMMASVTHQESANLNRTRHTYTRTHARARTHANTHTCAHAHRGRRSSLWLQIVPFWHCTNCCLLRLWTQQATFSLLHMLGCTACERMFQLLKCFSTLNTRVYDDHHTTITDVVVPRATAGVTINECSAYAAPALHTWPTSTSFICNSRFSNTLVFRNVSNSLVLRSHFSFISELSFLVWFSSNISSFLSLSSWLTRVAKSRDPSFCGNSNRLIFSCLFSSNSSISSLLAWAFVCIISTSMSLCLFRPSDSRKGLAAIGLTQ